MTDRVIKETEKTRRLEVIPDVHDMPEIANRQCQTFLSETQCHGLGDISEQFPVYGQSSCNTVQSERQP